MRDNQNEPYIIIVPKGTHADIRFYWKYYEPTVAYQVFKGLDPEAYIMQVVDPNVQPAHLGHWIEGYYRHYWDVYPVCE